MGVSCNDAMVADCYAARLHALYRGRGRELLFDFHRREIVERNDASVRHRIEQRTRHVASLMRATGSSHNRSAAEYGSVRSQGPITTSASDLRTVGAAEFAHAVRRWMIAHAVRHRMIHAPLISR